ncbi:beta-hydroxyacyl-ACP dehydratase [Patescibacteria group bacterium]|nr:beta-hydroxyacyl-ACP dehydratase [Patescibacteria group bacterium]
MSLSREEIKKIIPYDDPFLFVDTAEIISENEVVGSKETSPEDYYFKGHFVNFPIMPGVLIVEGIAQLASLLLRKKVGENHQKKHILAYQVRRALFYKPVFPGNKITYKVKLLGIYEDKIANFKGEAFVNDDLKCEVRFSCAIVDKKEFEEKYKNV